MAQSFLAAGEERGFIACFDDDDPVGIEPGLRQRRREEIGARDAPQHLTGGARSYTSGEQDGGGAMHGARGAAGDFMKGGKSETRARQDIVDRSDAKRQHARVRTPCADAADVLPKLAHQRVVSQVSLPNMFLICSKWPQESNSAWPKLNRSLNAAGVCCVKAVVSARISAL